MASEALKKKAQQAICTCYFYDLANELDYLTSEELEHIIKYPQAGHLANDEPLTECPDYVAEQVKTNV